MGEYFQTQCAAGIEFCLWVEIGTEIYIPHCKYEVKPHYLHGF